VIAQDGVSDALLAGDSAEWRRFVRRYGGLIVAAVRGIVLIQGDIEDLTQEVFVRLCKDNFRLLRTYDPARAALSTWLTIVARSTARDALRRRRLDSSTDRDGARGAAGGRPGRAVQKLKLPDAILSPRQREILAMLYGPGHGGRRDRARARHRPANPCAARTTRQWSSCGLTLKPIYHRDRHL